MFDRIEGLRTLVLGEPGSDLQRKLNQLVLSRKKTGTSSVDDGEYAAKNEPFETVGEREWLVDELGQPIALIEYTTIERVPFKDVSLLKISTSQPTNPGSWYTLRGLLEETSQEIYTEDLQIVTARLSPVR